MMSQQPIRMTGVFRNANIKARQMADADANGEWQIPPNITFEAEEECLEIPRILSTPFSKKKGS